MTCEPIVDGWTLAGLVAISFSLGVIVGAALVKV